MELNKNYKYKFVYFILNTLNGKGYVGAHRTDKLNDGYFGSGVILWRAINKYGKENFVMQILEFAKDDEELIELEKLNIVEMGTRVPNGYNIRSGGYLPDKKDLEMFSDWGKKGGKYKRSDETREKISKIMKGRYPGEKNHNYGNNWTEEMKLSLSEKLSASQHNKMGNNVKAKAVILFDLINEKSEEFSCTSEIRNSYSNLSSAEPMKYIENFQYFIMEKGFKGSCQEAMDKFLCEKSKRVRVLIDLYKLGERDPMVLCRLSDLKVQYVKRFLKSIKIC